MFKNSVLKTFAVVSFLALMFGCAKAPEQNIKAAQAAIDSAKAAGADRYSPEAFKKALDTLNAAMAVVDSQEKVSALGRNYDNAKRMLSGTVDLADSAKSSAATNKSRLYEDANKELKNAQVAVAEAKDLLTKVPKGKKENADLVTSMEKNIDTIESSLSEASKSIENGDYMAAGSKALTANESISSLRPAIENAISTNKDGKKAKK